MSNELKIPQDASAARWVGNDGNELGAGTVGSILPSRYKAFVRIFHPAMDSGGRSVKWAEIAAGEGREMQPGARWASSPGAEHADVLIGSDWTGVPPQTGFALDELKAVCRVLEDYTKNGCFFGLWDGWQPSEYEELWQRIGGVREGAPSLSDRNPQPPRFSVPPFAGRDYFLLVGPLWSGVEMMDAGLVSMSPNFIWPEDRSWLLVSDIDLDSTLVGGSEELVQSILMSKEIEAWRVEPETHV